LWIFFPTRFPCWHVYRKSVLVIHGKKRSDVGRITGRVCMERTTTQTHQNKIEKLMRNSVSMLRSNLRKKLKLRRRSGSGY
jgi:hypothetical protein